MLPASRTLSGERLNRLPSAICFPHFRGTSATKGYTPRILPNRSAFRKRDDSLLRGKYLELLSLVPVEFYRDQHEKAWASPNTLGRILARVLHTKAARMARCPLLACLLHAQKTRTARSSSARRKTAKRKNSSVKGSQSRCYNFR